MSLGDISSSSRRDVRRGNGVDRPTSRSHGTICRGCPGIFSRSHRAGAALRRSGRIKQGRCRRRSAGEPARRHEMADGLKLALFGLHRGSSADPDTLVRRARRAEEIGLESFWVGDHIALPAGLGGDTPGAAAARGRGGPRLHGGGDAPRAARNRGDRAAAAATRAARQAAVDDRLPLEGPADRRHRRWLSRAGAPGARRVVGRPRRAHRRVPDRDARALG